LEFDEREERCIIGEEEAIWALRFVLPYINEVLIKIKALFSGDPSTTMKVSRAPPKFSALCFFCFFFLPQNMKFLKVVKQMWANGQLAVLLFALARCGSSITLWTLAKMGNFLDLCILAKNFSVFFYSFYC